MGTITRYVLIWWFSYLSVKIHVIVDYFNTVPLRYKVLGGGGCTLPNVHTFEVKFKNLFTSDTAWHSNSFLISVRLLFKTDFFDTISHRNNKEVKNINKSIVMILKKNLQLYRMSLYLIYKGRHLIKYV